MTNQMFNEDTSIFTILNYILGFFFGRIIRLFTGGIAPWLPSLD